MPSGIAVGNRVRARGYFICALEYWLGGVRAVISTTDEYEAAKSELSHLEEWLARLQREHPASSHGLSKAGVRKMIARLHEELAIYEGSQEVQSKS